MLRKELNVDELIHKRLDPPENDDTLRHWVKKYALYDFTFFSNITRCVADELSL